MFSMSGHQRPPNHSMHPHPVKVPSFDEGMEYLINTMTGSHVSDHSGWSLYDHSWVNHPETFKPYSPSSRPRKILYPPSERGMVTPERPMQAIGLLPPEVWLEIARWCMPVIANVDDTVPFGRLSGPFQLSHVSGGLRLLVHSCPALWSTISLTPNPRNHLDGSVDLVKHYLTLSRSRPLTIILRDPGCRSIFAPEGFRPVFELLLDQVARWQTLVMNHGWFTGNVNFKIRTQASMLTTFIIQGHPEEGALGPFVRDLAQSAPHVRHFRWDVTLKPVSYPSELSWHERIPLRPSSITKLSLDNRVLVVEALQFFSQAPLLTHVALGNVAMPQWGFVPPPQSISLPNLQRLSLDINFEGHNARYDLPTMAPLLAFLHAPRLQHATFKNDPHWSQQAFNQFLRSSACSLSSLTFHNLPLSPQDLGAALSASQLQSLNYLTIHTARGRETPLTPALINAMTPTSSTQSYAVPVLQSLALNADALGDPSQAGYFAKMVKRRCRMESLCRLRKVEVLHYRSRHRNHPDLVELANFAAKGYLAVKFRRPEL